MCTQVAAEAGAFAARAQRRVAIGEIRATAVRRRPGPAGAGPAGAPRP